MARATRLPRRSGSRCRLSVLGISLESLLALLQHLLGLGQLVGRGALLALAEGNLLLELGHGVFDVGSERLKYGFGLLDSLFLCGAALAFGLTRRVLSVERVANLLLQRVVGILIEVGTLVLDLTLELVDADLLVGEFLVIVGLLLDKAPDRRGRYGKRAGRGHGGRLELAGG